MRQIALPLARAGGPWRFIVAEANRQAVAALGHPETWPFRTALLIAPPRSGKTSLARWFEESGLGEAFDDAPLADETALFHRWNAAQAEGRALLLTAGEDPWKIALPDLASRIGAALPLAIGAPDDAMLADLVIVHAEARGLSLGDDGARYLGKRLDRSHLAAERVVAVMDRLSLEAKVAPGPAIWRSALAELADRAASS